MRAELDGVGIVDVLVENVPLNVAVGRGVGPHVLQVPDHPHHPLRARAVVVLHGEEDGVPSQAARIEVFVPLGDLPRGAGEGLLEAFGQRVQPLLVCRRRRSRRLRRARGNTRETTGCREQQGTERTQTHS